MKVLFVALGVACCLMMLGLVAYGVGVTIALQGIVATVDDPLNVLGGTVKAGDPITGRYAYDSSMADTNPLPTVADYSYEGPPYGIAVCIGGLTFATDSSAVRFVVEIVNDHGAPGSDGYLLRSYSNHPITLSGTEIPVRHISWQLDDPSMSALSSTALTTQPPDLPLWTSIFGLTIEGGGDGYGFGGFLIRAHVFSATLVSTWVGTPSYLPCAASHWAPSLSVVGRTNLWMAWTGWEGHYCSGYCPCNDLGIVVASSSDGSTFSWQGTLDVVDRPPVVSDVDPSDNRIESCAMRLFAPQRSSAAPAMVVSPSGAVSLAWADRDGSLYFVRANSVSDLGTAYASRVTLWDYTTGIGVVNTNCPSPPPCRPMNGEGVLKQYPGGLGPAMIEGSVGGKPAKLYLAWTGTDGALNLRTSPDNGKTWSKLWPPLPEFSYYAPALCVYGGRLYVAWTGTDGPGYPVWADEKPSGSLNVVSSDDGITFSGKTTLPQQSGAAPALAVIAERLAIAWKDPVFEGPTLHVLFSRDGVDFENEWVSPAGAVGATESGPTLSAGFGAEPYTGFIAWQEFAPRCDPAAGNPRIGILEVKP